jgi:hypothetical protein
VWTYPYKRSDPLQQFTSICSKWQFPIFVYRLISNNVIKLYDSSFCLKLEFINFPSNWKRNSFYCNLFRSGYRWGIQFIKNARWHRTSSYMAASSLPLGLLLTSSWQHHELAAVRKMSKASLEAMLTYARGLFLSTCTQKKNESNIKRPNSTKTQSNRTHIPIWSVFYSHKPVYQVWRKSQSTLKLLSGNYTLPSFRVY